MKYYKKLPRPLSRVTRCVVLLDTGERCTKRTTKEIHALLEQELYDSCGGRSWMTLKLCKACLNSQELWREHTK